MFKKLLKYYFLIISLFFIERIILFFTYEKEFSSISNKYLAFLIGLRFDTIVASFFLVIPLILLSFSPKILASFIEKFLKIYFLIIFGFFIYMSVATFPFFAEYDLRPNFLFVEFLKYPKEVLGLILTDYKLPLSIAVILIYIFGKVYLKTATFKDILEQDYFKRVFLFPFILVLLFIGVRSSFGHRPANLSDAMFSNNRILNEMGKNSVYTLFYSIYAYKKFEAGNIDKTYGKIDIDEAFSRIKKLLNIKNGNIRSLNRFMSAKQTKKNIIIFIIESLGYQFLNETLTPNIMKLKNQSLFFTNLYSNGTRSIRGIAGLVAGNYSIPGLGIVKRNKSQNNFFTLNKAVKPYNYKTMFFYGGESRFDNMKGWFLGNGFDEVYDEEKITEFSFKGNWGVGDRDVVKFANKIFTKLYKNNQKFAAVIFSTTNHTPFDLPKDFDYLKGYKKRSRFNTVHYTDKAIGDLIKLARKNGYLKDTIIVVSGDHNIRVYGKDVVPVDMFQIGGFIIGGGIKAQIYNKQVSQPDILATTLDLAGISGNFPIMGNSIFSDKKRQINLMQFHDRYALMIKNKVAVAVPYKGTSTYIYKNKHLIKTKKDTELEKDLLAFLKVLDYLYQNRLYK